MCAKLCIPVDCSKIHDSAITVPARVLASTGLEDLSSTVDTTPYDTVYTGMLLPRLQ